MSSSSSNGFGNAKSKLMKAFETAKSAKEMLKKFHKLEQKFFDDEILLGLASMTLAKQFSVEGNDPEQVLLFGKRALKTLIDTENQYNMNITHITHISTNNIQPWPLLIASILTLLGEACCQLSRFDESLSYLNWANRNFCKLVESHDEACPAELVLPCILATEIHLFNVKKRMDRKAELVVHAKKILEIKEKIFEEDCRELAKAYEDISYSYFVVHNFKEALPFCLRAVEMYVKHFGQDSVEVVRLRRNLAMTYNGLKEYDKAIEQHQLVLSVLKDDASCVEVLIGNGEMLMHLGRYGEALAVLKRVVSNATGNEIQLAQVYIFIAKAFVGLEKFGDAKNHMKRALRLFDKKGMNPGFVIIGLRQMVCLYEELKDFETAISMLLRLLRMTNIPQEIIREYSTRHAELIMRKEKAVEGQGPSEEDKLDEAFALLKLMKDNIHVSDEDFSATNTESINSKDRKPSSSGLAIEFQTRR